MTTPKGWTKHPGGQTQVFPVTGWKTATAMEGKAGVIRVEFATEPTMKNRESKQLILAAPQVRALSQALAQLADKLDAESNEPDTPLN